MPEMQREEYRVYVVGRRWSPRVQEYRDFLLRNGVPFRWVDIERDPLVRLLSGSAEPLAGIQLPFFLLEDGSRMKVFPTVTKRGVTHGQMVEHLRMNGIVPPASRGKPE